MLACVTAQILEQNDGEKRKTGRYRPVFARCVLRCCSGKLAYGMITL